MKKLTYIGSLLVAMLFVSVAAQAQDVVLASIGKSGQTQLEVKFDDKYMNFGTAGNILQDKHHCYGNFLRRMVQSHYSRRKG